MKVTGINLDIRRTGEFMSGTITLNGVRQDLRVIPRNIEFEDLMKFFVNHVVPAVETGRHGGVGYRKGKAVERPQLH